MLAVTVRFKEKDATVLYEQGVVTLDQILQRYLDTPFDVTPTGPVSAFVHNDRVTLRSWFERPAVDPPKERSAAADKKADGAADSGTELRPVSLFVELVPREGFRIDESARLSLPDPPTSGLGVAAEFQLLSRATNPPDDKIGSADDQPGTLRFVAQLTEAAGRQPGESILPVGFRLATLDAQEARHEVEGQLRVVLRTARPTSTNGPADTGVALLGGTLQLRLGHLCKQRGCVTHFHQSLREIGGLGGVRPHSDLQDPRATVYLRAGQAVDVWGLRETLRDRGVEIVGLTPAELDTFRLRVQLPSWRADDQSDEIQQCLVCRDRMVHVLEEIGWANNIEVAGGGINFASAALDVELVELLDAIAKSGSAPSAVWFVPAGAAMPKPAPPQLAKLGPGASQGGSQVQPVVEFDFGHSCDVGTDVLSLLSGQKWASWSRGKTTRVPLTRVAIADRKYAALSPLLGELRGAGHLPKQIRLREFGDIRIQIAFAHICGEVEYSKPPKPKKKSKKDNAAQRAQKEGADQESGYTTYDSERPPAPKPAGAKQDKKPFVPKPLRPAKTSNGRQAIEAAIQRVDWIKQAVFEDYHTRPEFNGPQKLTISLAAQGEDVVRLDELIQALRTAGFPPKSVTVSRRFSGLPFAKPYPADLELVDPAGIRKSLASLKQPDRPLALAFVSLKCKRHEKYQADPKLYQRLARTVDAYRDRVDFVAISANPDDQFAGVTRFWKKTGLTVPLFHDAAGALRAVLNASVPFRRGGTIPFRR